MAEASEPEYTIAAGLSGMPAVPMRIRCLPKRAAGECPNPDCGTWGRKDEQRSEREGRAYYRCPECSEVWAAADPVSGGAS